MTCHHTTKPHSSGTAQTDIFTYRYNGKMVYVPVALNYIQALSYARDAFPQLKGLRDASLSLSVTVPGHKEKLVSISALAWPTLLTHMPCYQIIDVQVTHAHERGRDSAIPIPNITITYVGADDVEETEPAPPYRSSDVVDDEKASYPRSRPQSPSMPTLHSKRSWFNFQKLHG